MKKILFLISFFISAITLSAQENYLYGLFSCKSIDTNKCIWSGQASASMISTPFHSHSFLIICPMSAFIFP